MEDIYENLENYEDVYDVNELKNENKELKLKLEEYSRAMNRLQKDFDKLNSEYKKLEINYSSLLKTARAEIERKGEIIKNLNLEKDKLIIGSLQKNGVNMLRKRSNFHVSQKSTSSQDKLADSEKSRTKESVESKDNFSGNKSNRLDPVVAPSLNTISSLNNENRSTFSEEKLLNVDKHKINNKEMKENITRNCHKDSTQTNALSKRIMNRRKSTPATSFQESKFSSDEEVERLNVKNVRRSPPRSIRYDNRDYRLDSCNYYGSSDSNRSRNSNHMDSNTYRHADNSDMKRSQRYVSPERHQHRHSNDYSRHRLLKSPPPDKYNHSKSRDRRYNHDRERENYNDRHRYYEHSSLKHKMRNDFDEPSSKRQKTEQYSKCPSQDSNYISDREKEFGQFSCQSPDYVHSENHVSQHFIKEIRNTAALDSTSLEDPRISSKKYILQNHNDQTFLSIPSNRDIYIQCVDKTIWGIEKVEIPEALKNKPSSVRETEDYLNQIYSNMEGNESLESGDIQSIEDVVILNSKELKKDVNKKKHNITKESENENMIDTAQQIIDLKVSQKSNSSEYRIPKKSQKSVKKLDTSSKDNDKKTITYKGDFKISIESKRLSAKLKDKEHDLNLQTSSSFNSKQTTDDNKKDHNKKNSNKSSDDKTLQDKIKTVKGDLELSDEESDPMEFQKEIEDKLANNQESCAISSITKTETKTNALKKIEQNVSVNKADKINTEATILKESSNSRGSSKESCRESGKKRRGKKKSESKETTSIKDPVKDVKDKKKGSEKDNKKSSSEQTVNKFSDLFGDSSSLITPDDLGIEDTDTQVQNNVKYTSIFENTQDAIYLSVEDIKKAQVSTTEVNTFDNVVENLPTEEIANKTNYSNVISNLTCENDKKEENSESSEKYENTKGETLMESSNVVKTVIISTGVQPPSIPDNNLTEINTLADDKSDSNHLIIKKCSLSNIKAVATSTPQKFVDPHDTNLTTQDSDSNTINATVEINLSSVNNSSSVNANEHETEDVPDVRIFVRRRRKVVRKATT
ncbi:unnamed protein product, partial [Brenthis ino]